MHKDTDYTYHMSFYIYLKSFLIVLHQMNTRSELIKIMIMKCFRWTLYSTRMWYMISSPAMPRVRVELWSENVRMVATSHYRCHHHHKNNCIWHNLLFWLFCSFQFYNHPIGHKMRSQAVSMWVWPLACDLEKSYLLRSSFVMYNIERLLRYSSLLTRYCPCNMLPEPTSPKH